MRGLAAGICSVTLRAHSVEEVVALGTSAGLECIEWGGDVHVPHGDLAAARMAASLTEDAGMWVCSYGSYLFADDPGPAAIAAVLDTAEALGAPAARVWAPFGVEPGCPPERFGSVAGSLHTIAEAADRRGLVVQLEFHGGTLSATARSARQLLAEVGADNVLCGWQPPYWDPVPLERELADLALLAPNLAHLHVYSWRPDGTREALSAQADRWPQRLATAASAPDLHGSSRAALLEFVTDDDPEHLMADAAQLISWLRAGNPAVK